MAQITCQNVALGYDGKVVVEDINFSVKQGDYLFIIGENGSGKSTLIKVLLKLKAPIRGNILLGEGLKTTEIGYLPQQTSLQRDFPASVYEIVLSGCLNRCGIRPYYNKNEKLLAKFNLEKMGISNLAKKSYRELSGGQQQRVLLARALCATQKILILDEPVTGLDPKTKEDLYTLIQRLNSEDNITIIMVSHDITAISEYGSHILHLNNRTLFFGEKDDYINSDIGKAFISSIRRNSDDRNI